ncbi:uncharacterized protein N7506_007570 [Penicillium brevicompactum]|uniref:uncharacterized protein n=1 Tax=Penicillium brevicompactum TaxID=5074 RepID=UPI00254244D8|nr:uncharacterized protein N7506_007570 [Penicillium brevicompactum]KAJ5333787.1 hypothetical protein N7506_007570 [Penicillium brevicompactum]
MDSRRRADRSFQDLLKAERDETENVNAAWHRALGRFNSQDPKGEYIRDLINSCTEIPLALRVGYAKPTGPEGFPNNSNRLPAVNAAGLNHILSQCKPNDPVAREMMLNNTMRLIQSGAVEKLGFNPEIASDAPGDVAMTDNDVAMTDASSSTVEVVDGKLTVTIRPDSQSDALEDDDEEEEEDHLIDLSRVQEAHRRLYSAMGGYPDDVSL